MRTTLTLDPDVARLIEQEAHRARKPVKQVVNEALRRGLSAPATGRSKRYRAPVHRAALRAGLDRARMNALADEVEDQVLLAKATRRR